MKGRERESGDDREKGVQVEGKGNGKDICW